MNAYRIASISLILTLICYLHPAFGFRYQNARWRLMDLPIPCYLNTDSIPEELATDDVEQAIIRSLAAWDEAAGLQIFEYAGRIQLESPLADDGWNAISFVLTDWLEVTDRLSVSRLVGATTCTWSVRDAIGAPPRHTFVKNDFLRAFDIVINAENYRWTIGAKVNQYDLQSIITHELGHVLSLGRPDADPHPADAPTMVERMFPTDTKLRTLEPDDIAGVQSIYRKASGTLREDAQWENMVFINGDVIVPRGVSLKISHSTPQTIVHFSPGSKLIIEGGLTVGAATFKQVLFTGVDGSQWGEEVAGLPPVQFQPTLDEFQLVQAGWRVEFVGIQKEGTQDSEGLANETLKKFPTGCQFLRYDAHFRVVNLDPRTPGFSVQPLLSPNAEHNIASAFQPGGPPAHFRTIDVQRTGKFKATFLFPEDLHAGDFRATRKMVVLE